MEARGTAPAKRPSAAAGERLRNGPALCDRGEHWHCYRQSPVARDRRHGVPEEWRHARERSRDGEPCVDAHHSAVRSATRRDQSGRGGADPRLTARHRGKRAFIRTPRGPNVVERPIIAGPVFALSTTACALLRPYILLNRAAACDHSSRSATTAQRQLWLSIALGPRTSLSRRFLAVQRDKQDVLCAHEP